MNAVAMTAGAVVLIAGSVLAGESLVVPQRAATWVALTYLVLVGSVVVFVLLLFVLRHWAAWRTAYVYVLVAFVTVALSAWLDDEPVSAGLTLGGLLVLAGVYVGALRPARTAPTPPVPALGPAIRNPSANPGRPRTPRQ
jgi:drug/metabolite transporter (DMT)-like permease